MNGEESLDKSRIYATFAVTFAVLVWGASFIATKIALRDVSPVTVVWLRFSMGLVVLGGAVHMRRQFVRPRLSELGYFSILGFLGITFHQWLQSTGLQTSQASTTAWIVATTPVFIAILGRIFLSERLLKSQIAGIVLAMVGVLLVVSGGDLAALDAGRAVAPGDWLIMLSAPNWAVFSVLSRRGLKEYPAARMMFYVMAAGWLFTSIFFFSSGALPEISNLTTQGWLGIGFLGIFCSGFAYVFWYDALKTLPASDVGVFLYLEPLVAVGVAALLLGEPITWASTLGGVIIIAGVWLVNRYGKEK